MEQFEEYGRWEHGRSRLGRLVVDIFESAKKFLIANIIELSRDFDGYPRTNHKQVD